MYLINVYIDPNIKTGDMTYEDGHIQGEAIFSYERTGDTVKISNVKRE